MYIKIVGASGNGKTSLIKLLWGLNIECIRHAARVWQISQTTLKPYH